MFLRNFKQASHADLYPPSAIVVECVSNLEHCLRQTPGRYGLMKWSSERSLSEAAIDLAETGDPPRC